MANKRGQLTLSFNWIFVLIAGTMILLFFVGIIMKQKTVSEQKLNFDVVTVMDSILTGSTVSEQTINFVDISGLSGFELFFDCELDDGGGYEDIFAQYGITGTTASSELPMQVLFAPKTMEGNEMITWSLPYKMPFKVMDLLMVTSTSIKYYVIGGKGSDFRHDLENATSGFTIEFISDISEISAVGNLFHVRVIDLDGSTLVDGAGVPEELANAGVGVVTGVLVGSTLGQVDYFTASGDKWNRLTGAGSVPIIATGLFEKEASLYGALFAADDEVYKCNMMKAFKRYSILVEIYQNKLDSLSAYHALDGPGASKTSCKGFLSDTTGNNMEDTLSSLSGELSTCIEHGYDDCLQVEPLANQLHELNANLRADTCERLY
ncbi:hypothetical protein HOA92_04300 [archaeon]|jgi:hypothetical protein|nr:hypothetical protein [archaeon]MBT6762236.1 hypothetical protein [archaeon]